MIQVLEPATEEVLAEVPQAGVEETDEAVARAKEAFPGWRSLDPEERSGVMHRLAEALEDRQEDLATLEARNAGKAISDARAEMAMVVDTFRYYAGAAQRLLGDTIPVAGGVDMTFREPLGVVGLIVPWNFPLAISSWKLGPALACGNTVVLKPAELTPLTALRLAELALEAGLPEGVLHVLPGGGAEAGSALVEDPNNQMISFTGSTPVGRKIGEAAGRHLKRAALELGGNNAFVVLEDADVEVAASGGAWGSFLHQGQICMATGRHLVHESIAPDYVEALTAAASKLRVGDPFRDEVEMGPIIDQKQLDHVDGLVQRTIRAGARATTGAEHDKLFYRPTVLTDLDTDAPAYAQEIFGPVAPVVTFSDDEEAIRLANDSEFGLKAAVHSSSYAHALEVGGRLEAGAVHINDVTVNDEAVAPFPAIKASGNQTAFGGPADAHEFTRWQWVTAREKPNPMPLGAA